MTRALRALTICALALSLAGCGSSTQDESGACAGPSLPVQQLLTIKQGLLASGPAGFLAPPNPIDATGDESAGLGSGDYTSLIRAFSLPDLLSAAVLDSGLIKIRAHQFDESPIAASGSGQYDYSPTDIRYSQVVAYHSVEVVKKYIEALGFTLLQDRPLYVVADTNQVVAKSSSDVNAYFNDNLLDPSGPRSIQLVGGSNVIAPPGVDQDVYFHEFGHYVNESVSREVGINRAGEAGAIFTEAAAIHECLADYLAESISNKPYIGRWIAKNFQTNPDGSPGIPLGKPLRAATDEPSSPMTFAAQATPDGTGAVPGRYGMGEWCERALWQIRSQFANGHTTMGPLFSDLLIYSAVSLLKQDTSMSQFYQSLQTADAKLYCGKHAATIQSAFTSRGFPLSPPPNALPLVAQVQPLGAVTSNGQVYSANLGPGVYVLFNLAISNPNPSVARNVRVQLSSNDSRFITLTYLQGFGDLPPGGQVNVPSSRGVTYDFTLTAVLDNTVQPGSRIPYVVSVLTENGPTRVLNLELNL